jgi:vesicle coat complex subunit
MEKEFYFQPSRKGEIAELRRLLRQELDAEGEQRLPILQRVVAYMALGFDMIQLLPEMVLCSHTPNMRERKLVSYFLAVYAGKDPSISAMAINTFLKGLQHPDEYVRRFSLRSMAELAIPTANDFLMAEISSAVTDRAPPVRLNAVLATVRLFRQAALSLADNSASIDLLYSLIRDDSPQVSAACLAALDEILQAEAGVVVTWKLVQYLVQRFDTYEPAHQPILLQALAKYVPRHEEEALAMLNGLDHALDSPSSAVMLATARLFLQLALGPKIKARVLDRVAAPLLAHLTEHLAEHRHELAHAVLMHILHLAVSQQLPPSFKASYPAFLPRFHEPLHIKRNKLRVLGRLACPENVGDVLYELGEAARTGLPAEAMLALRDVACGQGDYGELVVKEVLLLAQQGFAGEALPALQHILQLQPALYPLCKPFLTQALGLPSTASKRAYLQLLLQFPEPCPHNLQALVEDDMARCPSGYKRLLLTACLACHCRMPGVFGWHLRTVLERFLASNN